MSEELFEAQAAAPYSMLQGRGNEVCEVIRFIARPPPKPRFPACHVRHTDVHQTTGGEQPSYVAEQCYRVMNMLEYMIHQHHIELPFALKFFESPTMNTDP